MVNDIGVNEVKRIFFKSMRDETLGMIKRSLA